MNPRIPKPIALPAALLLSLAAFASPASAAFHFELAPNTPLPLPTNSLESAVADFDGDGDADVATAVGSVAEVVVRLGDGGSFPTQGTAIPLDDQPNILVAGDVNGDGLTDIVVATRYEPSIAVLLGDGDGGFTRAFSTPTGEIGGIAIADVTGSSAVDLLASDRDAIEPGRVSILVGAGDGTFTPGPSGPAGRSAGAIVTGDLNGDAVPDYIVSSNGTPAVSVLLGDGARSGGFDAAPGSPFSMPGAPPGQPVLGDFDGDGDLDVAVPNTFAHVVTVLQNDGSGAFSQAPGSPLTTGPWPSVAAGGDVDGDGTSDLVVVENLDHRVHVLLGGSGGLVPAPGSPFGPIATAVEPALADFDGDGRDDLGLTGWEEFSVLLNVAGEGPPITLPSPQDPGEGPVDPPVVDDPDPLPGDPTPPTGPTDEEQRAPTTDPQQSPEVSASLPDDDRGTGAAVPFVGSWTPPTARITVRAKGLELKTTALRVRGKAAVLTVVCPRPASACSGTVVLRRGGGDNHTLASARFSSTAGGSARVGVKLTAAGRRALTARRGRALPVRIVVAARDLSGRRWALTRSGSLR